jgi:hypothetical protein
VDLPDLEVLEVPLAQQRLDRGAHTGASSAIMFRTLTRWTLPTPVRGRSST